MSAADFKEWMSRNGKTVQDVATELQIHFNTVYRYLHGKPVHRSTRAAIERLVRANKQDPPGAKTATG